MTDLLLRKIRKGILNDSWGEVVSCKPLNGLSGCRKLVSGKESRGKLRQIRNYEIRYKTSDECEIIVVVQGVWLIVSAIQPLIFEQSEILLFKMVEQYNASLVCWSFLALDFHFNTQSNPGNSS